MQETPNIAAAIIPIKIDALPARNSFTPVNIPTNNCTALVMPIFHNRVNKFYTGWRVPFIWVQTFSKAPAIILTPTTTSSLKVDFLPLILANVRNVQVPGQFIERKTPGIAQPVSPNFRPATPFGKRIIDGDSIWVAMVNIDTQQLA